MSDFNLSFQQYFSAFENYLTAYTKKLATKPEILGESMKYSLQNGGKRIRPVLALATADALGLTVDEILPLALAIEMIHAYSLVHDDLPSMDNDDNRRG